MAQYGVSGSIEEARRFGCFVPPASSICYLLMRFPFLTLLLTCCASTSTVGQQPDVDFFEKHIRPTLIEHCYACHSEDADEVGGGLLLDSAQGWQVGGDSGAAIVPGKPEESPLIDALLYESVEMPPEGKLPPQIIEHFKAWIRAGAKDPRVTQKALPIRKGVDIDSGRDFWAFQPPRESRTPETSSSWCETEIDAFVWSRRKAAGLQNPPDASPEVVLRRLAFDLTGLPPEPALLHSFVRDPSLEHWQRIVEEYLASREFAEHWGRHWLDVARYADSNGGDFNATFHDAWRYRDFVLNNFAWDRPFDQFIVQQLAGDLLDSALGDEHAENLIATGFLMLGAKMLSERDKTKLKMDIIDEQIDTVGRAFLGLTLGCARCHDHKFDPIPTKDYYALAGIFGSTKVLDGESQKYVSTWVKRELPSSRETAEKIQAYQTRLKEVGEQLKAAEKHRDQLSAENVNQWLGTVVDDVDAKTIGKWKSSSLNKARVGGGYIHDDGKNKGDCSVTFTAKLSGHFQVRLSYCGSSNRASNVPVEIHHRDGLATSTIDQSTPGPIEGIWEQVGEFEFEEGKPARVVVSNKGTSGYVIVDAVQFLPVGSPSRATTKDEALELAQAEASVKKLQEKLKQLKGNAPPPVPRAMAVRDEKNVTDAAICVRGEPHNKGAVVRRGGLQVLMPSSSELTMPEQQSGRLELARWIADPNNPLTARVIVNRVWMHLLGEGLVKSVDNFGNMGERPSHPRLLDTLAVRFTEEGWSIKRLIRQIVNSHVYRQSTQFNPIAHKQDPENRLLWRGNRRCLPAESIRDAMLIAGAELDRTPTTAPMNKFGVLVNNNSAGSGPISQQQSNRRSLYLSIVRGQLPTMLQTFDFADPDVIVGKRNVTNVPAQALVMLNSPEVREHSKRIALRIEREYESQVQQIEAAYLLCLQRFPKSDETELAAEYLSSESEELASFIQILLASTEYRYLD